MIDAASARRAVRLVLLWMLAVALPLQGLAAAAMAGCGVGQGTAHGSTPHVMMAGHAPAPSPADVQHVPEHLAHPDHHGHPDSHGQPNGDAPASTDHSRASQTPAHGSCSVCAACCTAAALLPAPLMIASPPVFFGVDPVAISLAVGFITDAPERPPRTTLA